MVVPDQTCLHPGQVPFAGVSYLRITLRVPALNRKTAYVVVISIGFRNRSRPVQAIKETIVHLTRTGRVLTTATAIAMVFTGLSIAPAFAHSGDDSRGGHSVVRVHLMGSQPAPASPVIAGINPGGAPWVNDRSTARVREDGRIKVKIRGLVIPPPIGTGVNPVASVVATLVCNDTVGESTDPFSLSPSGDGRTRDTIAVPEDCADPTVLIQPAANRTLYIASGTTRRDNEKRDDK